MIHHVFANRSNVGDWLAAKGIQSMLRPHLVAEHLCDAPFVSATLDALEKTSPDDLIVIGGGGLFMDYFLPFWEGFRSIAGRKKFCIWGVGYCDLKSESSRPSRKLLAEIVKHSRLCVVRDELTRQYLSSCELPTPVACPSVTIIDNPKATGHGLLHVVNYTTVGVDGYEAMTTIGRSFADQTGRPYRTTNNRIEPGSDQGLAELLRLYVLSDVVLSSALHGCVIGIGMGRPVVAVSGDFKIEGFMEAAGLSEWVLAQNEIQSLPERLRDLPKQRDSGAFLAHAREQNLAVAAKVLEMARTSKKAVQSL